MEGFNTVINVNRVKRRVLILSKMKETSSFHHFIRTVVNSLNFKYQLLSHFNALNNFVNHVSCHSSKCDQFVFFAC